MGGVYWMRLGVVVVVAIIVIKECGIWLKLVVLGIDYRVVVESVE
jgi:hypothetical protein